MVDLSFLGSKIVCLLVLCLGTIAHAQTIRKCWRTFLMVGMNV